MSKKMKKAKSFLAKYGLLISMACGVLVLVMAFVNAVVLDSEYIESAYTGFQVAFGKKLDDNGIAKIDFSILAVLAYLLPVIVAAVSCFVIKNRQLGGLITAVVFLLAAILLFIMPSITSVTAEVFGKATTTSLKDSDYVLAIGAILGGVFASLGCLSAAGAVVSK